MKHAFFLLTTILASAFGMRCAGQEFAVKTNVLYDATMTINLGAELEVAPKWSVELSGNFNGWNMGNGRRWKHWLVQPEARYWFCEALGGHFLGMHLLGGKYNIGHLGFARDILGYNFSMLRTHRYQGWLAGAGVAYGYSWMLGRHWNFEAEIGLGWVYTKYDRFECAGCGRRNGSGHKNYVGPTKAALSLVYVF